MGWDAKQESHASTSIWHDENMTMLAMLVVCSHWRVVIVVVVVCLLQFPRRQIADFFYLYVREGVRNNRTYCGTHVSYMCSIRVRFGYVVAAFAKQKTVLLISCTCPPLCRGSTTFLFSRSANDARLQCITRIKKFPNTQKTYGVKLGLSHFACSLCVVVIILPLSRTFPRTNIYTGQ